MSEETTRVVYERDGLRVAVYAERDLNTGADRKVRAEALNGYGAPVLVWETPGIAKMAILDLLDRLEAAEAQVRDLEKCYDCCCQDRAALLVRAEAAEARVLELESGPTSADMQAEYEAGYAAGHQAALRGEEE